MRNFWLDRIERRKEEEIKKGKLKKIGEDISKSLRKKGKKDGN
jgi:hypothetical protein